MNCLSWAFGRRAARPLLLFGTAALLAVVAGLAPVPRAQAATLVHAQKAGISTQCNGWSSTAPSQCGTATGLRISPAWNNNVGCGGYYQGSNPKEMQCRGVSVTVHNLQVPIRYGYWTGSGGFGWSKAYYYHNLWMQPMLDTIHFAANPTGSNSSRNYEVYHYTNGELDQEVVVVADIQDGSFAGVSTQDGYILGVLTGYCNNEAGAEEPECPDWVDSTL